MGMYTSVVNSEVMIINKEGLKKFLEELKGGKNEQYIQQDDSYASYKTNEGPDLAKAVTIVDDYLDFSGFDGWKIISYWYPTFVQFLRDVAVFIEGQVELEFENHDEAGWIEFEGGKCIIHTGVTRWSYYSPEEMRGNEIPELSNELKTQLVARKL